MIVIFSIYRRTIHKMQALREAVVLVLRNLNFGFSLGWKASKTLLLIRIALAVAHGILPIIRLWFGKEIINLLASAYQMDSAINLVPKFVELIALQMFFQVIGEMAVKLDNVVAGLLGDLVRHNTDRDIMTKATSLDISFFESPTFYNELANSRRDSSSIEMLNWNVLSLMQATFRLIGVSMILKQLHWSLPLGVLLLCDITCGKEVAKC